MLGDVRLDSGIEFENPGGMNAPKRNFRAEKAEAKRKVAQAKADFDAAMKSSDFPRMQLMTEIVRDSKLEEEQLILEEGQAASQIDEKTVLLRHLDKSTLKLDRRW